MRTITLVDTSYSTNNIGDEIIMDAVNQTVLELFPDAYIYRVASHEPLSPRAHGFIRDADLCFVGGTNILSSKLGPRSLWRVTMADAEQFARTPTITLGTGWERRTEEISSFSESFLKRSLSPRLLHSVRDSFTKAQLDKIAIGSVNTSCPTTWSLTPEHCSGIDPRKSNAVLFSHTAWLPDRDADGRLMRALLESYDELYFFAQMRDDLDYAKSVRWDEKIRIVPPNLKAYDAFLKEKRVDYVGSRLHGGIRALQHGRRALILAVDHRASEIARDTGLPAIARDDIAATRSWIEEAPPLQVRLPQAAITAWKQQFRAPGLDNLLAEMRAGKADTRQGRHGLGRLRKLLR